MASDDADGDDARLWLGALRARVSGPVPVRITRGTLFGGAVELVIRALVSTPGSQPVEIVERKGRAHPDTLCDAIAELISVRLCRYYVQHFGVILHHNVDKVLLCAGSSRVSFGHGEIVEPIEIYLGGRATTRCRGEEIPVHDIARDACRDVLRTRVHGLDVDRDVIIVSRLRPGSADLSALFAKSDDEPLANDTSVGVGFAPLTELERAVLEAERSLNDPAIRLTHREIGEDVKVMGVRRDRRIALTIGCAFVAPHIRDAADYIEKKRVALDTALVAARQVTRLSVDGTMNAADDIDRGKVFLTASGTSAEAGDDGQVGRGNRTNGLITPYRVMTLEAAAGKNPVNHCGKLYSVVASRVAAAVLRAVPGSTDATCVLVSQIGRAISDPQVVDVCVSPGRAGTTRSHSSCIQEAVQTELGQLPALRDALLEERVEVF